MGLDICWPIGYMFTLIGVLLSGYGLLKPGESMSLGININLVWGIVLALFGLAILGVAVRNARKRKNELVGQPETEVKEPVS